jgi:hypothetical protein
MASKKASVYYSVKIGSKREYTHEGFLICRDVPVARTGQMLYGPEETPVPSGPSGIVKILRYAEDLFNAETMASGLAKSVTIQHPEQDVTPENWKEIAAGTSLNVRRGDFEDGDELMLMDLVIQDKKAIKKVEAGLQEISLGYDAEYFWDDEVPGVGWQKGIIINHIALVDAGRCGFKCAIKDSKTVENLNNEGNQMAMKIRTVKKTTGRRNLNRSGLSRIIDLLFKAKDAETEEDFKDVIKDAENEFNELNTSKEEPTGDEQIGADPDEVHIHVEDDGLDAGGALEALRAKNESDHAEFRDRLGAIEEHLGMSKSGQASEGLDDAESLGQFLEDEAPEGLEEGIASKAKDSKYLEESFAETIAAAEILAPGIKLPTYDRANAPGKTASNICAFRKKALKVASTNDSAGIIAKLTRGKGLDTSRMTCDAVRTLFYAAVESKKSENRSHVNVRDSISDFKQTNSPRDNKIMSISELNEFNAARWGKK